MEIPSAYLNELQDELQYRTGAVVSVGTVCRTLHRLGITHKKLRRVVISRSECACAECAERRWQQLSADSYICLCECRDAI